MGKKSRLKRERRLIRRESMERLDEKNNKFLNACTQLRMLFSKYSASDVVISLCVSDLWVPNISSQIKHLLAFKIAVSMNPNDFGSLLAIDSFKDFQEFIRAAHKVLPSFPMLEDYVPESDWGDIRYSVDDELFKIFYGGSVERTPDFITSFFLLYGDDKKAHTDMFMCLKMQHFILEKINKSVATNRSDIKIGNLEVPSEEFWQECREVLIALSDNPDISKVTKNLIVELGVDKPILDEVAFVNFASVGKALPYVAVYIENKYFPICLRNIVSVVIDFYSKSKKHLPVKNISIFIAARFQKLIEKPFRLATRARIYPQDFATLLLSDKIPILIFAIDISELHKLPEIEATIKKILEIGDWWVLTNDGESRRILSNYGDLPKELNIIAIASGSSTAGAYLKIPNTRIRLIPLADFVTLFDSIKNTDELVRYLNFLDNQNPIMSRMVGMIDQLAAFREADGVLIDGAFNPNMLVLDPHWGSSWRYQELCKYWSNILLNFPDLCVNTVWKVDQESHQHGLYRLEAKGLPALSWSIKLTNSVVHLVLVASEQLEYINAEDGHLLETLIHCLADSLNQRQDFINFLSIFPYKNITIQCRAKLDALVSQDKVDEPLFSNSILRKNTLSKCLSIIVDVNLQKVYIGLSNAIDSTFEVLAIKDLIVELAGKLNIPCSPQIFDMLETTSSKTRRFMLTTEERKVHIPDYFDPKLPRAEQYKIARREIAFILKSLNIDQGVYTLQDAKNIIDQAKNIFRQLLHKKIASFERDVLVKFCVEQIDQLTAQYDNKLRRIQLSLKHDVDYNRSRELADAHENFIKNSKNYRYLLEACISFIGEENHNDNIEIDIEAMLLLVAYVDWHLVLYSLSDVLHNGLDVAGIIINNDFVPEIFYENMNDTSQEKFSDESSSNNLGIGLNEDDEVKPIKEGTSEWNNFILAFNQDTGITLENLYATFIILYSWCSYVEGEQLSFSYKASRAKVIEVLVSSIQDLNEEEAELIINFILLEPKAVRRLLGRDAEEIDVPLWEHNKRDNRYTIKPLIKDQCDNLIWGAAMIERASRVWMQNFRNGYMPADFDWPNIVKALDGIKNSLEQQLEKNTAAILLRATPYTLGGIDFKRRFPRESFSDVGDFDGLAYWPETNTWITAECKYNQPAFCFKDARRLRDRIFDSKKAHMPKIQKRREFLIKNMNKIIELLKWPLPAKDISNYPKVIVYFLPNSASIANTCSLMSL